MECPGITERAAINRFYKEIASPCGNVARLSIYDFTVRSKEVRRQSPCPRMKNPNLTPRLSANLVPLWRPSFRSDITTVNERLLHAQRVACIHRTCRPLWRSVCNICSSCTHCTGHFPCRWMNTNCHQKRPAVSGSRSKANHRFLLRCIWVTSFDSRTTTISHQHEPLQRLKGNANFPAGLSSDTIRCRY